MNEYAEFPEGPPPELLIWRDNDADTPRHERRWRIWFDKCPPMFADGDYSPFREKVYHYQQQAGLVTYSVEERETNGDEPVSLLVQLTQGQLPEFLAICKRRNLEATEYHAVVPFQRFLSHDGVLRQL